MMTVAVHERWSGQAARAAVLREFIAYAQGIDGVRFMRRCDIARWWLDHAPALGEDRLRRGGCDRRAPPRRPEQRSPASRSRRSATSTSARAGRVAERSGARAFADWEEMLDGGCRSTRSSSARRPRTMRRPRSRRSSAAWPSTSRSRSPAREPTARRSSAAWRQSGAVCAVGYQWRSLDVLDELRALLRGAQPGLLVSRSFGPTEGARRDLEQAAAVVRRPGSRAAACCSSSRATTSISRSRSPARSSRCRRPADSGLLALAGRPPSPLDDAVAVLLRFAGGGIGAAHVAWSTRAAPAALRARRAGRGRRAAARARPGLRAARPRPRRSGRRHGQPCIRASRRSPASWTPCAAAIPAAVPCSPADALATLRALLACERAIASGERVAV